MDFQYVMAASDSLLCSSDSPARNSSGWASGFHSRPPSEVRSVAAQSRRACSSWACWKGLRRLRPAGRAVAVRPGLQQRVRGGQHHLLQVGGRQVGPHRGLHAGVHLHGAHRAGRVDGDQAGLGQVVDGGADHVLVGRVGGARPAGDVAAGGRAGQHGAGHAVVIEHRGQHQRRPGQPGRRQLVRALRGDGPGGQHRGRDARHGGHVPIRSASSARYSRQPCLRALIAAVAWASASGSPSRSSPRSSASIRWSG